MLAPKVTESLSFDTLPVCVQVDKVIQSRYESSPSRQAIKRDKWFVPILDRPMSWDERIDGIDLIQTSNGDLIKLKSTGMQSVPQSGWFLILTSGNLEDGFEWTLYGLGSKSVKS